MIKKILIVLSVALAAIASGAACSSKVILLVIGDASQVSQK